MIIFLLSLLFAEEPKPNEVIKGVSIYHSKGRFQTYKHIMLTLTPQNIFLPNDPKVIKKLGLSRNPDNYRNKILDEKSTNFLKGQFEVYMPVEQYPLNPAKNGYMILRMPSTSSQNPNIKEYISQKQALYFQIKEKIEKQQGEVKVVVEISDSQPRNLFFRDAGGKYINYVGQYKKEK